MLVSNRVEFKLSEKPGYLEGALLMADDRVVLVTSKINPEEAVIYVYDFEGNMLHRHEERGEIRNYGTINGTELFGLVPALGDWIIFNVKTFNVKRGKFPYRSHNPFMARVHLFPESNMICIWEIGDFNEKSGRITFFPYPPPQGVELKPEKVVEVKDIFNHNLMRLNNRNRIAYWEGKVVDKFKWTVVDFERELKVNEISIAKFSAGEFCLKNVIQLKRDEYLLDTQSMQIDHRYIIYNDQTKEKPRKFDTQLSDNVFDIYSVGSNIFVCQFNVTPEGEQREGPMTVISKETRKPILVDKCFIGFGTNYFVGQTNDNYLIRIDMVQQGPQRAAIQTQRVIPQKELYLHMLTQLTGGQLTNAMAKSVLETLDNTEAL